MGRELRHILRTLGRSPGFAAANVLILALGIGANLAIFNVLNVLVVRPIPVWRPERLVQLSGLYRNGSKVPFSYPLFRELARGERVFSNLFGWSSIGAFNVEAGGALFLSDVRVVTGNYFPGLGVSPLLGRLLTPADVGETAGSPVAVIGYEFWDRRMGRDPAAIGKTIRVEGRLFTIVGVTRKWFTGMTLGRPPEVTLPVTAVPFYPLDSRSLLWVFVTGRLKDGLTIDQARARLAPFWSDALRATVPTQSAGERRQSFLSMGLQIESAAGGVNRQLRDQFMRPLYLLMGIVGLILLVACTNCANLALARTAARSREISTRLALGASRGQILRRLLAESLLLSAAGAVPALALADRGSRLLVRLMTQDSLEPVLLDLRPDWRVLVFTLVAVAGTTLLIGLAPAWRMSREEPSSVLRRSTPAIARGTGTLSRVLIVAQIAMSLVLLQGAALFLGALENLRSLDAGYEKAGVLEANLNPQPEGRNKPEANNYRRQLLDRIAGLPGVLSAAYSTIPVPAGDDGWRDTASLARADTNPGSGVLVTFFSVSPGFFKTLGIASLAGRDFEWADDEKHPKAAVIDANLARRLAASRDVTGEHIRFGVQPELQDLAIIGVVHNARILDLRSGDMPVLYVSCLQYGGCNTGGTLLVRAPHPAALARVVETEVRSAGHEYSAATRTLEELTEGTLIRERATTLLSGFFAAVALVLVAVGLFGLMSYGVTLRTRELGIRLALGSAQGAILRMILGEAVLLTVAGIGVGLPCAYAAGRLIRHFVFGPLPAGPFVVTAVSATLLAVGLAAGYLPARRAMKMDPSAALRSE